MGVLDSVVENFGIQHAVIEIVDTNERSSSKKTEKLPSVGEKGSMELINIEMEYLENKINDSISSLAKENMPDMPGVDRVNYNDAATGVIKETLRQFKVQFNPSTLKISGYGGGLVTNTDFSEGKSSVSYGEGSVHMNFSVQLIFDEILNITAFNEDKLKFNTSAVTSTAANLASKKLLGRASVRDEVEAFIGAMRDVNTRRATFSWGKMSYSGVLNGVSARYTMFNPSGKPIRAVVDLRMVLFDEQVSAESQGLWGKRYSSFFSKNKSLVDYSQSRFFNFNN